MLQICPIAWGVWQWRSSGQLSGLFCLEIRTRRIGANPEKSGLVNFRGPDWRKFSELCVLLFFLGKTDKMLQNPGLVNQFSATPRGHLNWTGPIANGSDETLHFHVRCPQIVPNCSCECSFELSPFQVFFVPASLFAPGQSKWPQIGLRLQYQAHFSGEIQKGTGGRGRDRKCHKLSWRLSQIVVTFYDDLWRFMTFYVNGIKRRKLS